MGPFLYFVQLLTRNLLNLVCLQAESLVRDRRLQMPMTRSAARADSEGPTVSLYEYQRLCRDSPEAAVYKV